MSKHTERRLHFVTRQDPDTGASVTRLTPTDVTCHRNYFYQKCFTNDGAKLIFGAEFGPGRTGTTTCWTCKRRPPSSSPMARARTPSAAFSAPMTGFLYFVRAERHLIRLEWPL